MLCPLLPNGCSVIAWPLDAVDAQILQMGDQSIACSEQNIASACRISRSVALAQTICCVHVADPMYTCLTLSPTIAGQNEEVVGQLCTALTAAVWSCLNGWCSDAFRVFFSYDRNAKANSTRSDTSMPVVRPVPLHVLKMKVSCECFSAVICDFFAKTCNIHFIG